MPLLGSSERIHKYEKMSRLPSDITIKLITIKANCY